jgi:hypothetical protein
VLLTLWGSPARRRALVVLLAAAGIALAWPLFEADLLRWHGSRAGLIAAQKARGYQLVGTLGRPDWPAIVVGRDAGTGGVEFVTADGQPHRYEGFAGPMKALHLRAGLGGGKAFTLVFHRPPERPRDALD